MSIDLGTETLIPLAGVSRMLPPGPGGKPVSFSSVWRWALRGIIDRRSGERVKLETVRVGGRLVTSMEAVQRFADRLSGDLVRRAPARRSPSRRRRASDQAARELERLGI